MQVGLTGCGVISSVYLESCRQFGSFRITKCSDLNPALAKSQAEKFGIIAVTPDELLADPDINIILNLTPPKAHKTVNLRALESGKHVYSEKPFALNLEDADEILEMAEKLNLQVASAPDSFLGGAHQTAKSLIEAGEIGQPHSGTASIMHLCGYRLDHPNAEFFFKKGGGPLFDMGPYYISALVDLLGPVSQVACMGNRASSKRICAAGINRGEKWPVEVDTHKSCLLKFASGPVINFNASFDVWSHHNPRIEIYGTGGCIQLPEPSAFGGPVKLIKNGMKEWQTVKSRFGFHKITRGLGLADMVQAINSGNEPECSAKFARHVLKVLCLLDKSSETSEFINI